MARNIRNDKATGAVTNQWMPDSVVKASAVEGAATQFVLTVLGGVAGLLRAPAMEQPLTFTVANEAQRDKILTAITAVAAH